MAVTPRWHHLSDADLSAIASGQLTADVVRRLRAAALSKHLLLIEALRRHVVAHAPADVAGQMTAAGRVLADAQARDPGAVADVLLLPHLGFWAATCLSGLGAGTGPPAERWALAPHDAGNLASFAAVAALRSGQPFELTLPARAGVVSLPGIGSLRLDVPEALGWVRLSSAGGADITVTTDSHSVSLTVGGDAPARRGKALWTPAARLRLWLEETAFDLVIETADPYLTGMCPAAAIPRGPPRAAWRRRLAAAWDVLARHHRPTAGALAAGLSTVVPLAESAGGRPVSAASGHAWGAIALSLPADPLSGAETLVHEFHHLVLGGVEDIAPLVRGSDERHYYAPWRDDPRPLPGLLQGSYAFFGVTSFWRRQRHVGPAADRLRGEVEFARGRRDVLGAVQGLATAADLTKTGAEIVCGMLATATAWQEEPTAPQAQAAAAELSTEHWLRWRLAHLSPVGDAVDALARAWLAGPRARAADAGARAGDAVLTPSAHQLPSDRSLLMQLRFSGPRQLRRRLGGAQAADAALVRGDDALARQGYLRRVADGDDPDAWAGLLLVRARLAPGSRIPEQPELVAAVYERVRALTGAAPDAEALIAWLTGAQTAVTRHR